MNINNLMARYKLKSRAALYKRMHFLGVELMKDFNGRAYASERQLMILDQLDQHIKAGQKMSTFTQRYLSGEIPELSGQPKIQPKIQPKRQAKRQPKKQEEIQVDEPKSVTNTSTEAMLENTAKKVITNINTPKEALEKHTILEEFYQNEWIMTTEEVEEILNRRPKKMKGEDYCVMNGWKFVVKGKERKKNLWQVQRLDD